MKSMRTRILYSISFLLAASCIHGAYITELTDNNFFDYAKDRNFLFTEFYAPWCSDCQKLAPEIDKAADTLGTRSADIAKVDCFGAGSGLCQMYGVRSWPQLKTFRRGTYVSDYTGAQTGDAMAMYVESMSGTETPSAIPAVNAAAQVQQAPYAAPAPEPAPEPAPAPAPAGAAPPAPAPAPAGAAPPAHSGAPAPPAAPAAPAGTVVSNKNQKAEATNGEKTINHAKTTIHSHKHKGKKREGVSLTGKLRKAVGLNTAIGEQASIKESHKDIKKMSQYRKGKKKSKRLNRHKLLLF